MLYYIHSSCKSVKRNKSASPKWTLTKKSIPLAADVYDNESISETDSQMNEGHFK